MKTKDIKKLNKISNAINSTEMYLWRLNSKPKEKNERVIRFIASNGGLGLSAVRDLSGEDPAFLVEWIK